MPHDDTMTFDLLIGGEWRPAGSGERITLINPATEEPAGSAAQASRADTEADIAANTARFTAVLEDAIRKYPSQWLWMHRRWKTRPAIPGQDSFRWLP